MLCLVSCLFLAFASCGHANKQQVEEAISKCYLALEKNPENTKAARALGQLLEWEDELTEALRVYETVAAKDGVAACSAAVIAEELGMESRAVNSWRLGLRDHETRRRARRRLIELRLRRKELMRARCAIFLARFDLPRSERLELSGFERRAAGDELGALRRFAAINKASQTVSSLRQEALQATACAQKHGKKYWLLAESRFKQALRLEPKDAETWLEYGGALIDVMKWKLVMNEEPKAVSALRTALQIQPNDGRSRTLLASIDPEYRSTESLDRAYIRGLFETFAPRFDLTLTIDLQYQGHRAVVRALDTLSNKTKRIADIGAGTGLSGQALRAQTSPNTIIDAVDLSPGMLNTARSRQVYSECYVDDAIHFLSTRNYTYDAIVAADLAIYLGNLFPLFSQVRNTLTPGTGRFALTIESPSIVTEQNQGQENAFKNTDGFFLAPSGRFVHSEAYVRAMANRTQLQVLSIEHIRPHLRLQHGQPVPGFVVLLALSPSPSG